jgi:Bacterial regulatory helix-turn-helix protein, lysR family
MEFRSFAGATAEPKLSKATVLKAIGRIEARLGAGLINRTPRLALTMHAPHKPAPHPSFVPVSLSCSRMAHRSEVSAGAPELTAWPLMRNSVPFAPPRTE